MFNIDIDDCPILMTEQIQKFRKFLLTSWPHMEKLMDGHDFEEDPNIIEDWIQGNWEMLVGREILQEYGLMTGFLNKDPNYRIIPNESASTHTILAKSKSPLTDLNTNKTIPQKKPIRLLSLGTLKNNTFSYTPPFDHAQLIIDSTGDIFITPFENLEFYLDKFPPVEETFFSSILKKGSLLFGRPKSSE